MDSIEGTRVFRHGVTQGLTLFLGCEAFGSGYLIIGSNVQPVVVPDVGTFDPTNLSVSSRHELAKRLIWVRMKVIVLIGQQREMVEGYRVVLTL